MPAIVVEAGTPLDTSGEIRYRFSCPLCGVTGAWHPSLTDAEDSARRHNKTKHPVEVEA
jgi:hypothetical protein